MLDCRGTNNGIFGALDYRVEAQTWVEDDGEEEVYQGTKGTKGAKANEYGEDDEDNEVNEAD